MPFAEYDFSQLDLAAAETGELVSFTGVARRIDEADANRNLIESFAPIDLKSNGEPDILLLRDHDRTQIIGGWKSFQQDGARLTCEGVICTAVEKARETLALMRGKYLNGLSVGWTAREDDVSYDEKRNLRVFRNAKLVECSIVGRQAQRSARIHHIKASDVVSLLTAGLGEDEMAILLDEGFEQLVARRKAAKEPPLIPHFLKKPTTSEEKVASALRQLRAARETERILSYGR